MNDDLIRAGFSARQRRNSQQELEFFKLWCEQQKISSKGNMIAAIAWEKGLSELKTRRAKEMADQAD